METWYPISHFIELMVAFSNICLYNKHMFDIQTPQSLQEKLTILADAAKYDVACTSSGSDRQGKEGFLGNAVGAGICHSFAADGRCISLLKILMTNHCTYDCKYCCNRVSNDIPRATFTPEEICELTIEFYKRNYIEGLFLSSGVLKNPTYTMEKMCETLLLLRTKYKFNGYIHIKTIPGASDDLLSTAGYLADRISINLELPTKESLKRLAPNKSFHTILDPMGKVSGTIAANRLERGKDFRMERSANQKLLSNSIFSADAPTDYITKEQDSSAIAKQDTTPVSEKKAVTEQRLYLPSVVTEEKLARTFAPAGQSTQMIIGAANETDFHLIMTSQHLYQHYDLKRVFYSAYIPLNEDSDLPALDQPVPLLREHRLYQADWLLRYYGFQATELLSEAKPNFNELLDPKCDWALRHLELFPMEVSKASYEMLLRIPGIGPKSAQRIVSSRRYGRLDFDNLKKMGVVLKRAHYFITCQGKMMYNTPIEEQYIERQLITTFGKENWQIRHQLESSGQKQLSLFDDFGVTC